MRRLANVVVLASLVFLGAVTGGCGMSRETQVEMSAEAATIGGLVLSEASHSDARGVASIAAQVQVDIDTLEPAIVKQEVVRALAGQLNPILAAEMISIAERLIGNTKSDLANSLDPEGQLRIYAKAAARGAQRGAELYLLIISDTTHKGRGHESGQSDRLGEYPARVPDALRGTERRPDVKVAARRDLQHIQKFRTADLQHNSKALPDSG